MKFRIILAMLLFAGILTRNEMCAQSVKDVIDDTSGKYLYAQSRDQDKTLAHDVALDELRSRVVNYLSTNGMTDYNKGWQDWVKQIVNEKFGIYRVFLYLSVEDLKPGAKTLSVPVKEAREADVGTPSILEKEESSAEKMEKSEYNRAEEPKEELKKNETPKEETIKKEIKEEPRHESEKNESPETKNDAVREEEEIMDFDSDEDFQQDTAETSLPEGMIGDLISMILEENDPSKVGNILAKGKNLRAVSLYGRGDTKYITKAFIVTTDGGKIHVYSPLNSQGSRVDYSDGTTAADGVAGKMIYWFLKK